MSELRYDGQVVVVTGAGGGYVTHLASSPLLQSLYFQWPPELRANLCTQSRKSIRTLFWIQRCQRCGQRSRWLLQGRGQLDKGMSDLISIISISIF